MATELPFVSTFQHSWGTLKMFLEDVRQSARLHCAAFYLSAHKKMPSSVCRQRRRGVARWILMRVLQKCKQQSRMQTDTGSDIAVLPSSQTFLWELPSEAHTYICLNLRGLSKNSKNTFCSMLAFVEVWICNNSSFFVLIVCDVSHSTGS